MYCNKLAQRKNIINKSQLMINYEYLDQFIRLSHYEINVFLQNMLVTIIGTLRFF